MASAATLQQLARADCDGIVDVRAPEAYAAGHLANASSFPLPTLRSRTAELPPMTSSKGLYVVAEPGESMAAALAVLQGQAPSEGERVLSPSKGWKVLGVIEANDRVWATARQMGMLESGITSRRLWSPSLHLPHVASMVEAESGICLTSASRSVRVRALCTATACIAIIGCIAAGFPRSICCTAVAGTIAVVLSSGSPTVLPRIPSGYVLHALDLGCGRGRDCIWLAHRGWSVIGVDNQPVFLEHLADFAAREGLSSRVRTAMHDLKKGGLHSSLLEPPPNLINISRFMSRALLDLVVAAMPVGCVLAVHHFTHEAVSLKSGRPIKCGNLDERGLEPGELRERYGHVLDHILMDTVHQSTDGRELYSFAARKTHRI